MYGYFSLWVFPFLILTTMFLRAQLNTTINKVSKIEYEYQRSRVMGLRSFGTSITQTILCALPFLLVLFLHNLDVIDCSEIISAVDQIRYDYAFSYIPSESIKEIIFTNGNVQIILAFVYYYLLSILPYSIWGYRKAAAARRISYSVAVFKDNLPQIPQKEYNDHWGTYQGTAFVRAMPKSGVWVGLKD